MEELKIGKGNDAPNFLKTETTEEQKKIEAGDLKHLADMVTALQLNDVAIASLEADLKDLKAIKLKLESDKIPSYLEEFGLSEIRLSDGRKIVIGEGVSVTVKDEQAFYKFLKDRHDDDIIKAAITIKEPENADAFLLELMGKGFDCEYAEKIHSATLKKYFRGLLEVGEEAPESVKLYIYKTTKIK